MAVVRRPRRLTHCFQHAQPVHFLPAAKHEHPLCFAVGGRLHVEERVQAQHLGRLTAVFCRLHAKNAEVSLRPFLDCGKQSLVSVGTVPGSTYAEPENSNAKDGETDFCRFAALTATAANSCVNRPSVASDIFVQHANTNRVNNNLPLPLWPGEGQPSVCRTCVCNGLFKLILNKTKMFKRH